MDRAGRRTRLEGELTAAVAQPAKPATSRATRLEVPPRAASRTVLADAPASAVATGNPGAPTLSAAPRLVGVLAAPDFGPDGSLFAVRQGRNTIGSGRACDICLSADPRVSLDHAVLLHRGDTFYLADRMSTNGTWVNGVEVTADGTVTLHDRDHIRCGGVELIFLVIERPAPDLAVSPAP